MKIIVLGAGVIGVTTAYFLARDGHEVEVVDRQPGPALETSFANAGEVSPGYASPWAAPGVPRKALQWVFMKHAPLIVRPLADPAMYGWAVQMLRNCTSERYRINKRRMMRVAEYSREVLNSVRLETGIRYDERMRGTLQLFRKQQQLDDAGKDIEVLSSFGVAYEVLDRAGCIAAEPGLAASAANIVGGLRLPEDETGDCHMFTAALAEYAERLGVRFLYNTRVTHFDYADHAVTGVVVRDGDVLHADRYVLAAGSFSRGLARPLGMMLPIYPVKGYSITAAIRDEAASPVSTILDETYKVAITRLGGRIRVGGMAELSGFSKDLPARRRETLVRCVDDLFPGAGDTDTAHFWSGLRPMTPDGSPIIGPTRIANLYINSGHGTLGWTMACGAAKVLADQVSARPTEIEAGDLGMARY